MKRRQESEPIRLKSSFNEPVSNAAVAYTTATVFKFSAASKTYVY